MDWDMAIKRNRAALKRVLAMLVAMAGLDEEPHPEVRSEPRRTLPQNTAVPHPEVPPQAASKGPHPEVRSEPRRTLTRRLYRAVLRLLRPAEAAARRLIIIAARDIVVTLSPPRPPRPKPVHVRTGAVLPRGHTKDDKPAARPCCLSVIDPPRRLPAHRHYPAVRSFPRICIPGVTARDPVPRPPSPDDEIDATHLVRRLAALGRALDDLPTYAKRFARWRARSKARRIRRVWPLRTGRQPGLSMANRRRPKHEIHSLLWDIHGLAYEILDSPDTS